MASAVITLEKIEDLSIASDYIQACPALIDDLVADGFSGNMEAHPSELWLGYYVDGSLKGIIRFTPFNSVTVVIHPIFQHRHRGYALLGIKKAMRLMLESGASQKIIALCPEIKYPHIEKLGKVLGMKCEGKIAQSWLKNGMLSDIYVYGT